MVDTRFPAFSGAAAQDGEVANGARGQLHQVAEREAVALPLRRRAELA
jgi:hypothetical protein